MSKAINKRPLLSTTVSDSESEDGLDTEIYEANVSIPDKKPFLKFPPKDRYYLAYIVFYLLGINTIIPWGFFITADEYWMYKFRQIHPNNTGINNYTHTEILEQRTDLQASFTSYLNVASAIPNTIFLISNAFLSKRISQRTRMIGSQSLIMILFIMTTVFVKINTDEWQKLFLVITLITVAFVNALSAIFGGSLLGIAGVFSPIYITAMLGGQSLGGIFAALTEICALWIGASPVTSGLIYFAIGDIVLLFSLIAYVILEKQEFFKYHMMQNLREQQPNFSVNTEANFVDQKRVSYKQILKRIWPFGLSVFLVFSISMAVYPAITVLIESQDKGKGYAWSDIYFVPVITYLTFSCGDYLGRLLCGHLQWPKDKPSLVIFLSALRVLFIPAFMFCNAQPRHNLPVYIKNDILYIVLTIFFAIGNGYLCNISFVLTPTVVDLHEKEIASVMMGAFLGLGLTAGSSLSLFLVKML
ncbi:hypothetical protein PV327_007399 [Microctonus hyperodae]|uniref:Equilibrative nucleoside transporter 3 n=2 Tax=Microctonus hyperodae TaxID=165561 RepID=A0AA39FZE8_MICHY|nr:hypothetical protein PV327_007399 [Microctonus hyperodae]